jgi:replicative DNA helicase
VLSFSDFSAPRHRIIWKTIQELIAMRRPFDLFAVAQHLQQTDFYSQVGGDDYFQHLMVDCSCSTVSSNVLLYAKRIKELSVLRSLRDAASKINDLVENHQGRPLEELLSNAESIFSDATIKTVDDVEVFSGKELMQSCLQEFFASSENKGIKGISTGFQSLDERTDGLQKGEMVIVAAPPSMGKTTFAVNLLQNALYTAEHPVVMFSMEMPAKDIIRRMWATESKVNYSSIRRGTANQHEADKMTNAFSALDSQMLKIITKSPMTPSKIRSILKRLNREYGGIRMAMVDYVQLMECDKKCGNRNEELTIISRELKRMAMEFNMPFIVLSQLTKTVETQRRRPTNGDLRESGALAQDADMIMMVHRQEKYDEQNQEHQGKAEIIITKSRNGQTGTSLIGFDGSTFRFYELNNHWSKI